LKVADEQLIKLKTARHVVTFREIRLESFLIPVERLPQVAGARTPLLGRFGHLAVSSATQKIVGAAIAYSKAPLRT
jgi:hypothetical protein